MMIRQGDILMIPVQVAPGAELGEPSQQGEVIVAHGEATGHRHRIPQRAALYDLPGATPSARVEHARKMLRDLPKLDDDAMPIGVVRIDGAQELVHEEHGAIAVEGDYLAVRQREYTPAAIVMVED